ncbi:MAG: DUF2169 domain-containing protein [Polyangiaceae bacterium]|nr:DUF2169 domain-containing protein [Polyangiaceae bacterium]
MNLSRICVNRTPMDVRALPMDDPTGREVAVVIAKMTWQVGPTGQPTIARPISPVRVDDVPLTDAALLAAGHPILKSPPTDPYPLPFSRPRSLRHASDGVPQKPGTEVLLYGTAYPSKADSTKETVGIRIESGRFTFQKNLTVTGPRVWQNSLLGFVPGPPGKMPPTPIVYELAYGGIDASDPNAVVTEIRNPCGMGFVERKFNLTGRPAPVIEDPKAPLSSRNPAPAGFGPIAAHWAPRSQKMGTLDDAWRADRAPVRPRDFNPRHFCAAPDDQWIESALLGDEAVEVVGLTPQGPWRFRLPKYSPIFHVIVRGITTQPETHLDTFAIDAETRRVEFTWRIAVPIPKKPDHLEAVHVFGSEPLPERVVANLAASVYGQSSTAETP